MFTFKQYLKEQYDIRRLISEASSRDDPTKVGGASNSTKGVLHELLVGRALNGGVHMERHPNINRETPEEAHNRLKSQIHPEDYKEISRKAESAANDIKEKLRGMHKGSKITGVYWTSKPGDTERVTGVKAHQIEDSSDIYVTTQHRKTGRMNHGISLKVSDKTSKNVPASSLGMGSSGLRARSLFAAHQKSIRERFPNLTNVKKQKHHKDIAEARKEWATQNPEDHSEIKKMNRSLLQSVAHHHAAELQHKLNSGDHEEVLGHIRKVLAATSTPAQKSGKATFIKHTTYKTAKGVKHDTVDPSTAYEHLLKDHKNIEVESSGANVNFYHRDPATGERKMFASQAHKFDSQSDPLSQLKSAGKAT